MADRIKNIVSNHGRAIPMLKEQMREYASQHRYASAETSSLNEKEPTEIVNEPLQKVSTGYREMPQLKPASAGMQTQTNVPLQKKSAEDMQKIDEANRRNYVLQGSYEDAMKRGDISPAEYVRAMVHKAQSEGRELTSYEETLKAIRGGDELTPEQQHKKERREILGNVFSNLGTLIGNVANLRNATRGGIPVELNATQQEQNARYQQLKEKREALARKNKELLYAAAQDDIKAARERAAEERRMAAEKAKFDATMQLNRDKFEYDKERDKAEQAFRDKQQAHQAKVLEEQVRASKANESLKWAQFNKPVDSVVASDGYVYTINRPLTIKDKRLIIDSMPPESVHKLSYIDNLGRQTTFGESYPQKLTDGEWGEVYEQAEAMGLITPDILVARGFIRGKQPMSNPAQGVKANKRQSYAGGYVEHKKQSGAGNKKDLRNLF